MASDRIDEHNMDIGTPLIICEGGTALVIIFEYKPFEITSKIYQIKMRARLKNKLQHKYQEWVFSFCTESATTQIGDHLNIELVQQPMLDLCPVFKW